MQKRDILLIAPSFAPYRAIRITSLATYLDEHDCSVTVMRSLFADTKLYPRTVTEPDSLSYINVSFEKELDFTAMERKYYDAVKALVERQHFDVAVITLGPFYTYACVDLLKEKNIPVILDYRDLCVYEGLRSVNPFYLAIRIRRWNVMRKRELAAIRYASRVVAVVDDDRERLMHWYEKYLPQDKVVTIFNGYDDNRYQKNSDMATALSGIDTGKRFCIGVFGKLAYYDKRLARCLFKAICGIKEKEICIVHVGEKEEIEPLLKAAGTTAGQYTYYGEMDYQEGMQVMEQMDALCIVSCTTKGALGTKLFDYIYLNKPIIVMENRSTAITKLMKSDGFKNGSFVCNSRRSAEKAIRIIVQQDIESLTTQHNISTYSRTVQNAKYYALISNVLDTVQKQQHQ